MVSMAISNALSGLHGAGERLEAAAARVTRAGTGFAQNPNTDQPQTTGNVPTGAKPASSSVSGLAGLDLAAGVVDAKQAANSYKASIAVIKTANKMFDALLDIVA